MIVRYSIYIKRGIIEWPICGCPGTSAITHPVNKACQALLENIIGIKLNVVNEFFVKLRINVIKRGN